MAKLGSSDPGTGADKSETGDASVNLGGSVACVGVGVIPVAISVYGGGGELGRSDLITGFTGFGGGTFFAGSCLAGSAGAALVARLGGGLLSARWILGGGGPSSAMSMSTNLTGLDGAASDDGADETPCRGGSGAGDSTMPVVFALAGGVMAEAPEA